MKKNYLYLILIFTIIGICFFTFNSNIYIASAESLEECIEKELDNLNLNELEDFYNGQALSNENFVDVLKSMLKGEYSSEYNSIFQYVLDILLKDFFNTLPLFITIIAIAVLCAIIQNVKGSFLSEGVSDIIFFVCILSIILIVSSEILSIWLNAQKAIKNISILSEIMLPIILTLMVASGGNVSASVYKPTVAFLSNGIINIINVIVFPLIGLVIIFSIVNCFSKNIKLSKFSDFIIGIIKWIIGISFTIYSIFVSVQGISVATFDGISAKAAKYAISNSIPIIGGYLRDGFDLMIAGSILIKNAIGVIGIFALFNVVIKPVLHIAAVSLLFKFTAAIVETVSDSGISELCMNFSKGITYISVALLAVGFMFFVTVLLMIFSANSFI